jgi:hypothetical protein
VELNAARVRSIVAKGERRSLAGADPCAALAMLWALACLPAGAPAVEHGRECWCSAEGEKVADDVDGV